MTVLQKQYLYQVYSPTGAFLGSFQSVKNDFSYNQNINSSGAQLEIVIAASLDDVGAVQTDEFWIDESGNKIIDEAGNHLVMSAVFEFNNIPIDLGNRVKVYVSYDDAPRGRQVFDGFISGWRANYHDETITITVLSWGAQLDNYLVFSDPTGQSINQPVYDKEYTVTAYSMDSNGAPLAQSFNIASPTTIGSFGIFCRASFGSFVSGDKEGTTIIPIVYMGWELYAGTPASPGALQDSGQINFTGTNIRQATLQLSRPLSLSGNYFLVFKSFNGGTYYYADPVIEATNTNPLAGGNVYTGTETASGVTWVSVAGDDIAFIVYDTGGSTALTFSNNDPAAILRRIVEQLAAQGSLVNYTSTSIDDTSTEASYSYKIQTMLEAINVVYQLSPEDFYWYVDVATNLLHFHRMANSVDHRFILGNHISSLDIEYNLDQMVNTIYFSGGPTGGVNLFTSYKDAASVAKYGQWLKRMGDNRVTDTPTADQLAGNEISAKGSPGFHTVVEIHASTYDIETIALGDTVGFRNFSNLIDTLLFQIVAKTVYPDRVVLTLGTLPPRASSLLDKLQRRLDYLETIDNPSAPS